MDAKLTMTDLIRMSYEDIWAYERKLGFIAKLYGAITHADNLRDEIRAKSVAPEIVMRANRSMWIYESKAQQDYARMIFKARGYLTADASALFQHSRALIAYLA